MAQQLQNINIVAPGFQGINTEDSPLAISPNYATRAENCIIDRFGRIASRKGYTLTTSDSTELNGEDLQTIHQFIDSDGNEVIFSCGNGKVMSGTLALTDETPAGITPPTDYWEVVNFNDRAYFFQQGVEPLVYDNTNGLVKMSSHPAYAAPGSRTYMDGQAVLAAYGKLWVGGFSDDPHTVYWSDTLNGAAWSGGASGSIDLRNVWPNGFDEVQALVAHNNYLIIFGKNSIVAYEGASAPASMTLADTIRGVGTISPKTVVYIGSDVLFFDSDGLRSFGRAIQEKALPISNLSQNIKTTLAAEIQLETGTITTAYSPENNFVLFQLPVRGKIYCFDLRGQTDTGGYKVTVWPKTKFTAFHRDINGKLYVGTNEGIGEYGGYKDNEDSYDMKYYSPALTFGDTSRLKIVKKLHPSVVGTLNTTFDVRWAYDFRSDYRSKTVTITDTSNFLAYYGIGEFGVGEYSEGVVDDNANVNATGAGYAVTIGFESTIDGNQLSIQEFNVLTQIGKMI